MTGGVPQTVQHHSSGSSTWHSYPGTPPGDTEGDGATYSDLDAEHPHVSKRIQY